MPEIGPEAMQEVTQALARYWQVVSESKRRPNSQRTRYWQANAFVLTRSVAIGIDDML